MIVQTDVETSKPPIHRPVTASLTPSHLDNPSHAQTAIVQTGQIARAWRAASSDPASTIRNNNFLGMKFKVWRR